ncbi:hypothetical protein VTL71DRAFT_1728 [Oculimacula yallundae]|uniref:Uncharacterized protein n=1 Tax=Oculimacula yallundae TaxID=86028 RepID=A0ABR4CBM6_9HELO
MQYSSLLLTFLAASIASAHAHGSTPALAQNNSTGGGRASGTGATMPKATTSGRASGTGATTPRPTGTTRANSTNTTTGAPVKVSGNAAQSLMAQGGGLVTIAGLGVAFAVFM